jgi:WD40 repeat protein
VSSATWEQTGLLAISHWDGRFSIWNLENSGLPTTPMTIIQSTPDLRKVIWDPDGTKLALVTHNKLQIWDKNSLKDFTLNPSAFQVTESDIAMVAWDARGRFIGIIDTHNIVSIWNIQTADIIDSFSGGHGDSIASVKWSPDEMILASGSGDGTVRLWDGNTGEELALFQGHKGLVSDIDWNSDGTMLVSVTSGAENHEIIVWDIKQKKAILSLLRTEYLYSVSWQPNSNLITVGGSENNSSVLVLDLSTGEISDVIEGAFSDSINSISWNNDGTLLAVGGSHETSVFRGEYKGFLEIWTGQNGDINTQTQEIQTEMDDIDLLTWNETTDELAILSRDSIYIWDAKEQTLTLSMSATNTMALAWGPDENQLTSSTNDETYIWNAKTGDKVVSIPSGGSSISWNSSDARLAIGKPNGTIEIWG